MRQQGKRIGQVAPANRLLLQREDVGFGSLRDRRYQAFEIGLRCARGEIAVEQRHVEGGMLAAHETGATRAVGVPEREREQHQRTAFRVVGDHDKGSEAFALANLPLPGAEEVEPLIRREEGLRAFQACARCLRRQRGRERCRCRRCGSPSTTHLNPPSGLQSRQPWSSQSPCYMKLFTIFGFGRPSQGNVNKG